MAQKSNAAVIGITESKLDETIPDSEIKINGYELMRCDRNRHGGGVACYVKESICFNRKYIFSEDIENIFFDILLLKTKPFTIGIFYRPPNENQFLEQISHDFPKLNTTNNDVFILGDMNINVMHNGKYLLDNNRNNATMNNVSMLFTKYKEFLSNFGLKQLITSPTRKGKRPLLLIIF